MVGFVGSVAVVSLKNGRVRLGWEGVSGGGCVIELVLFKVDVVVI